MYVIDVIPFSKGAPPGALSYRSSKELSPGALVSVPLRKKRVRGIVVSVSEVRDAKAELKRASFSLSGNLEELGSLPPELIEALRDAAVYQGASLGAVLSQLLEGMLPEEVPTSFAPGTGYVRTSIERPYEARVAEYRKRIETAEGTTLLVTPTLVEAARFKEAFKSLKPLVLSSTLTPTKRETALAAARDATGLVIATPAFSFVPIQHLGQIVLDRVSAGTYRFQKRPYTSMVHALEYLAHARALPLVLGDFPLPLEYREEGTLSSEGLGSMRILDVKQEEEKQGTVFKAVPGPMREEIGRALEQKGRIAVFVARRGYAPAVVCRTCGASVKDAHGRALTLATEKGERVLRTNDGTTLKDADAVCDVCGSWNLLPLGIGVERVVEELAEAFPDTTIVRFDTDTIRTPAQARKAVLSMQEPGTISVGTEFMLPWLAYDLDLACVASADSLLALPFWRSRERFLRLLLSLREHAKETLVATRRMDETALLAAGDVEHETFFEEETGLRKILGYPPFGTLIALACVGTAAQLDAAQTHIKELSAYPLSQSSDRPREKGRLVRTWVLSLPEGVWPDIVLSQKLAALPLSIRVLIDPDSLQ